MDDRLHLFRGDLKCDRRGDIRCVLSSPLHGISRRRTCSESAVQPRHGVLVCRRGLHRGVSEHTLSGFLTLELHDGQLTLRYILPERTVILPVIEVMTVQEEPAYKGRWRLILSPGTSGTYESALAARTQVQRAGEALRQRMVSSNSPRR